MGSGTILGRCRANGRDVACANDDEAKPELLCAIEIIDGYVATLLDTCLRAAKDCAR